MDGKPKSIPPFTPHFTDTTLQQQNPCPEFDDHIRFDDSLQPDGSRAHDYYIDGEKWKGSVSSFYHDFFPSFDADLRITRMMSRPDWETHRYYGMTSDQIKKLWKDIGDDASERGTVMHAAIECYYNADEVGKQVIINEHPGPDFGYFLNFQQEVACRWTPWRTELRVFDRELRLAGSVDMLYWSPHSTPQQPLLIMYDWKRSKKILGKDAYGWGKPPLTHLPNHSLSHYSIQLNVYKALIERNTAYRIESMWMGIFHPNQDNYVTLLVPDLQKEVRAMFEIRLQTLQSERTKHEIPTLQRLFQEARQQQQVW